MTTIAPIAGFALDQDGRYWNADATLGLNVNTDQTITLLDADGCPSNHDLTADHATHILARARRDGCNEGATMRLWDAYASVVRSL